MNRFAAALLAAWCCIATAQTPVNPFNDVAATSVQEICRYWKLNGKHAALTAELKKRGGFSEAEWSAIERGQLTIGMRELPMVCSLGFYDRVNRTVRASGTTAQYVYGSRGLYVYVENGIVTTYQN